ncbi:XRE family transcriptional regulator [Marispirochaeta sp.]|uniref:helix-turn-helix domain-containing protein n=1 Tax=Marispirochaeta sp. TaxID=2038653 RepID=UPI0029C75A19|nr:XRE family transcriptional regulator [Marispirochaeta sp.]
MKDKQTIPDSQNIGRHIRKLRKLQHRTLQDVADNCGFTKSLLSKIEGGKIVPPVATLIKIASALHTNISGLIAEGNSRDCVFVPAAKNGRSPVPTESGYSILPLAVEMPGKKMQPVLITVRPEDLNDKVHSHEGEELIFVLEGVLEFQVDSEIYTLNPGDSIFFNSIIEHHITGVHSDYVKFLDIFN